MTPEEKFNREVWWTLKVIKGEYLLTTTGENAEIDMNRATNRDADAPPTDDVAKCVRKLEEWGAFTVVRKYDANDTYFTDDWNGASYFELAINQQKFDELYRIYERGGSYPKNQEEKTTAATSKNKPIIREKTLELIAKKIGDLDSRGNLIKFLVDCGVDDMEFIFTSEAKWQMVLDAMLRLASSQKKGDKEVLFKIIGEAVHPLMHKGDESSAEELRKEFDSYLKYDNIGIAYDKASGTYLALKNAGEDEIENMMFTEIEELEERAKKQLEVLCQPENKEKVSLLRKAYQSLMNVVYVFCENPTHPTIELNNHFQFLSRLVNKTVNELGLSGAFEPPFGRNEHFFYLPFTNLFAAEKHYREQGEELGWRKLRPEMNAMYGDIEAIYQEVSGSDILAESDKQEKINEIQLYLSKLKEKSVEIKKEQKIEEKPVAKIEITNWPPLQLGNVSKNKLNDGQILTLVPIKDARLDELNHYLELNGGDTIISFKSKKSGNGLEKETKQFKILYQLWDFRWELKNGAVLKKGDYSSLTNLATASKSESTDAAYKHIQRLNERFKKAGVAIEIDGENEKYRLVINKA